MFEVLGLLGVILPFLDFRAQCLCLPLGDDWAALVEVRSGSGCTKVWLTSDQGRGRSFASSFYYCTSFLDVGWGGGGVWAMGRFQRD